jgi:aconitate hydratase 2 / 2-methylisocitrate dehydratase
MPGCSLCMGNQARIADNSTAVSTSTRNFPNRLGKGADVFLVSAELAAVVAIEGITSLSIMYYFLLLS